MHLKQVISTTTLLGAKTLSKVVFEIPLGLPIGLCFILFPPLVFEIPLWFSLNQTKCVCSRWIKRSSLRVVMGLGYKRIIVFLGMQNEEEHWWTPSISSSSLHITWYHTPHHHDFYWLCSKDSPILFVFTRAYSFHFSLFLPIIFLFFHSREPLSH